ncbi:PAS domain-containing sensor histidine kinase [Aurantiacibacter zhengii]|uniref:histidine kinase n=1 Tax=Aurantiacibacter zhengii TaxID=2307003 RepID=A0A418NPZ5_9SPHN|nr:PAS domain-containing sensor histidine kinase [Aurantiacibacter zhengii]RIV84515.1 PAS domain-containing sensor histidine kinase [Aurantiacibacter zhengii]
MDQLDQLSTRTWHVSPDMLCYFHADGTFAHVNPAWEDTLGWSLEEMIGKPFSAFLHPDDVYSSEAAFARLTSGEPVLGFENRYRAKDETYHRLSWVAVPEAEGRYFCSARDITRDFERSALVEQQGEEAELREQFLAVLGHDLRNPLAGLDSGISIIQRRSSQEDLVPVLEQMRRSVTRMDELISNMMDFARVRLGDGIGLDMAVQDDMGALLQQVCEEIAIGKPTAEVNFISDADRVVRCDAPRIQQSLSNLLANAVTHGDMSRPVTVEYRTQPEHFVIAVRNAGGQISEQGRANLFQPFFRGTPDESKQGLGLGLYIVSQIVSAHGGEIDVASENGETRFTMTIPG